MKKHYVSKTLIAFFFLFYSLYGVAQDWTWVDQIGSELQDAALGSCDKSGNLYVAGAFEGFECQFPSTTLLSTGVRNIFIAKFDQNGNEQWVQHLNSGNVGENENDGIGDLISDNEGNVYITGIFYHVLNFNGVILTTGSDGDMFIAKIAPDGTCLWAKQAGGIGRDGGSALALDSLNSIYVWGDNSEFANFDTLSVERGGFLAKYNNVGSIQWVRKEVSIPSTQFTSDVFIYSMTIFKNRLFAHGAEMRNTFTIDTVHVSHPGKVGEVLCCFDLSGNIQWLAEGLSISTEVGRNISADSFGNVYACGRFYDTITFSGNLLTNPLNYDLFICKYNQEGLLLWTKQAYCTSTGRGSGIFSNEDGYCYVTGYFGGMAIFGTDTIFSTTARDLFLARYTPDGECLGVKHFGNAEGWSVGMDDDENPYLVGQFRDTLNFGDTTLISHGSQWDDILALKCAQITGYRNLEFQLHDNLIIYANPTTGKCNITVPDDLKNDDHLVLYIYDSNGRLIQKADIERPSETYRLNIQAQAAGIYQAVLTNGSRSYTGKIVINR